MNDEEINFLKEEYKEYDLYYLFDEYLSVKQHIDIASSQDMGKEVIENNKTLDILSEEINSRDLEEKIGFLHSLSEDICNSEADTTTVLYCITQFIDKFLPTFDEED